jgi:hypothetical protein
MKILNLVEITSQGCMNWISCLLVWILYAGVHHHLDLCKLNEEMTFISTSLDKDA